MQTPITPQIHKLRPSGSRKNPHLNPILEESYGTRGKSSSSQEHDYNMKGSDSIKVKNDPSPFKNITNDPAKIVFVNNHKFITGKSKSPLKPEENVSKVILNKTIKPNEIVSER